MIWTLLSLVVDICFVNNKINKDHDNNVKRLLKGTPLVWLCCTQKKKLKKPIGIFSCC